jgi:hypothetical protein
MQNGFETQDRLLRSAEILKSYFEKRLKTSFELLNSPPDLWTANDVRFNSDLVITGLWGLRCHSELTGDELAEIQNTFETIIGSLARMRQLKSDLVALESEQQSQLQPLTQHQVGGLDSNVIPFRRIRRFDNDAMDENKRWLLRLDCLIESTSASDIHKMALELHLHSRRFAFLEFGDLDPHKRISSQDLLAMGAITVFIPNILEVSKEEQLALNDLMQVNGINRPLLMVGTPVAFSELKHEATVDGDFLASVSLAYIKLTKPFREYKEQGLIRFFLDSLSTSNT